MKVSQNLVSKKKICLNNICMEIKKIKKNTTNTKQLRKQIQHF